jgi:hypothetical protein
MDLNRRVGRKLKTEKKGTEKKGAKKSILSPIQKNDG